MLDVEHDLALDQQVVVEGQLVLGEVDGALDRVLDGDEADVDLAALDRVEHVGHRAEQHQLRRGEIGLGAERLLGERAERAEEPDPRLPTGRSAHTLSVGGTVAVHRRRRPGRPRTRVLPVPGGGSVDAAGRMA